MFVFHADTDLPPTTIRIENGTGPVADLVVADSTEQTALLTVCSPLPAQLFVVGALPPDGVLHEPTVTTPDVASCVGWSAALADLDGDGVEELIAGAPYDSSKRLSMGSVYVFDVAAGPIPLAADAVAHAAGEVAGDQLGWTVSADADADGDGLPDIWTTALGDPLVSSEQYGASPRLLVLSGVAHGVVATSEALGKVVDEDMWSSFGWAHAVGDVNHDDVADVAIANPFDQRFEWTRGRITVVPGPIAGVLAATDGAVLEGDDDARLGEDGVILVDIDGDGQCDVLAASAEAYGWRGAIWAWSGSWP